MVAMCVDPQKLEQHLAVEITVDTSCTDAARRVDALNNSLLCFLEGSIGAFDDDYELFSQRARAFVSSRSVRLVLGQAKATHHYEEGPHDVEASPSSKTIIFDISDNKE
ncbi:hypothetical protein D1007_24190 [Hordeum vulgare]|nr:hypothetical protein D1007_24190 [Hordeum vulgare]